MSSKRPVAARDTAPRVAAVRAGTASSADTEATARVGRPRATPRSTSVDPREDIVVAASRLFGSLGIEATTMSRIAEEAGLRQSSVYYYFRSKDEVVAAMVERANVVPLHLVSAVIAEGSSPATQLFRFIRGDVVALCTLPFDINEVHRIAARDQTAFASYWTERRTLERRISSIVRAGIAAGELRDVDARITALTIMSNDEAVQNWHRLVPGPVVSPRSAGTSLAELIVGGLLAKSSRLRSVHADADRLDAMTTT
jgi:TetR/AcrR family transcriptional regulator